MGKRVWVLAAILAAVIAGTIAMGGPGVRRVGEQTLAADGPGRLSLGLDPPLRVETLVENLDTPWDLAWGPGGRIWISERGGRISRVDPETGSVDVVGELDVLERGESGLMGLAFHANFETEPWVYAVHTYRSDAGMRNQLVRMRFDNGRLGLPTVLLNEIPGRANHDGSRLAVGPEGYIYMTTGDAGDEDSAHDLGSLGGKILRLTPDGSPAPDNPFGSAVFSFGHRNPQGLAFHPQSGLLYSAEHGPGSDDEVNLIEAGRDYGWPEVRGTCDERSRTETRYCSENDVAESLANWTPTIGISGLAVYEGDLIPSWRGSLLVTALRSGGLYRLTLSRDGQRVSEQETLIRGQYGRLRDVLVGPGGEIYVATSNHDGRGRPAAGDDRILRLVPEE